ncbi:hypothetical protein QVD17_40007 [Tagetes erecta]|uniref:Uncharacterized protein n=1 Tax=Tagetes erecta TaxID=13708 RepID=A0AAD8NAK1_TARER|nr:hypothetical protein QVD17_40007 [Tagetes erecta]
MDTKTTTFTFTFFTLLLLYTVSAARPCTVHPPIINPTVVKTSSESSASSKILLPGGKVTSNETTEINNNLPQSEKTTKNDVTTPHTNFSRFHPINRHFQGRPQRGPRQMPCHMPPPIEVSHKKDDVAMERTDKSRSKTFHGEVPTNWLKVKHHYGSHREQSNSNNNNNINISNNNNRNNHRDKNGDNVVKTKNVFDREKMMNLKRQQKLKKSHGKTGLMKNIRKFLKHTFD